MEVIREQRLASELANGTHKVGQLELTRYYELVEILGEPTYSEESFDGKIQVEWVIQYGEEFFTIYDWKTFDRNYTLNSLSVWSVGGNTDPREFIREIYALTNALLEDGK